MDGNASLKLCSPAATGPFRLSHRVALAPTTRLRSAQDDRPSAMMVEYYKQRAAQGEGDDHRKCPLLIRLPWLCRCTWA